MLEERLDFGAKDQRIANQSIVERLLADTVASHEELVFALIPYGESKHSA